jgi:AcrR family transcriptional regulator
MAEARRNRQALLDTAARMFADADGPVPLESIAAETGVGIGTLYRHFPSREALVEGVYADQMRQLHARAETELSAQPPAQALRSWMRAFADSAGTKRGMAETLSKIIASGRLDTGSMRAELIAVLDLFLTAGARTGDLRTDVPVDDVAAMVAGVLTIQPAHDETQIHRLLDLIVDSLATHS